jgi:hypothetical protein
MSQQLISRSGDLKRLRDEGYDVEVTSGYLLVKHVPYVNSKREVCYGTLISDLTLAGDVTTKPGSHVAYFTGDHPCNADGTQIDKIKHQSRTKELAPNVVSQHSFSSKPPKGYSDYYEKMSTYVAILSSPARSLDPTATARTFPVIESDDAASVFNYVDTASSRADTTMVAHKLEGLRLAIVGVGGTGSYVLDLVAKCPVAEIVLFDGDTFLQHNAFRAPGAASAEDLRRAQAKSVYFKDKYSSLHRNIIANGNLDGSNLELIEGMDFVFLCLDRGHAKLKIIEKLESLGTAFIDVGMGVELVDEMLQGVLRVTTSTPEQRDHVRAKGRIPLADTAAENDYSRNIQIADLNALNAALAVIRWKKLCRFYRDFEREYFSAYTIDGNSLINEDQW